MKRNNAADCPVNFIPVNETRVRWVAGFVFLLSLGYCLQPHWSWAALLTTDFFLRAFGLGRYSFFGWISNSIIQRFSLRYKPVDSAAKEFAALIGFVISDLLFFVSALSLHEAGRYISGALIFFIFRSGVWYLHRVLSVSTCSTLYTGGSRQNGKSSSA